MALEDPSLTVDTTSTSGVGTYTLDDPASPGGGLRTLADAVADGDVADTDTVEYMVVDTTTEGAALNFERGIGTVGGSGTTLTRDTIRQSSNAGAAVSWPGGGSRTVRVSLDPLGVCRTANNLSDVDSADAAADNIGAARLNASNDWTVERQEVRKSSAAGQVVGWAIANSAAGDVNNRTAFEHRSVNGSSTELAIAQERGRLTTLTAGSEDSELAWLVRDAGSLAVRLILTKDGLTDGPGTPYDKFPSGTRLLLGNNSLPSGWTIVPAVADKTILTTSTVSEIDDTAGSWTISGLTTSNPPNHSHPTDVASSSFVRAWVSGDPGPTNYLTSSSDPDRTTAVALGANTGVTGAGATAPVSSDGNWRPAYYKAGWIEKS